MDLKFVSKTRAVGIPELRLQPALAKMQTLQRGNRLSITPVTEAEWNAIMGILKE